MLGESIVNDHAADAAERRVFDSPRPYASDAPSVKAAWEAANIPLSLDSGYALYKRLWRCQSVIRTRLHSRAPPRQEERCAESSLLQMFTHLQDTFEKNIDNE